MMDASNEVPAHLPGPAYVRILGFPGPFRDWGVDLVSRLFAGVGRPVETTALPTTVLSYDDPSQPVRLLIGEGPDYGMLSTDMSGQILPSIVFLDDLAPAMANLLTSSDDTVGVTRLMTGTLAPLPVLLRAPNCLLIRPDMAHTTWDAVVALLLPGIAVGAPPPSPPTAAPAALRGLAADICAKLLGPMLDTVITDVPHSYELPWQCLSWRAQEAAVPVMDLAGPARPLYFGPYFHFLHGNWQLELELFFSDDVGDASFAAELFTDTVISRGRMRPGRGGLFRACFPVRIDDPQVRTELRLWVERGVIEGRMGLRKIVFNPH